MVIHDTLTPALLFAVLVLAGCAAAPTKTESVPRLNPESCPAAVQPVDEAALDAVHKTLTGMIALGQQAEARLAYTQCEYRNTSRKDDYLVAVGQALKADLLDYQRDFDGWRVADAKLNEHLAGYYGHCLGLHLDTEQYQACKDENDALNAERRRVDEAAAPLQQRATGLEARNVGYSADINALMLDSARTGAAYTRAMQTHAHWLAQAYALMISPELQPYAGKNGCPDIAAPPKSADALLSLGASVLACFKKTAGED